MRGPFARMASQANVQNIDQESHTVTHLVLIIGAWNIDLGSFCGPQARQRKGKVPNNPPEIDVDLPVGALYVEIY